MRSKERCQPPNADELEVSVFGPSKGECVVVHVPGGAWFVIDSFYVGDVRGKLPVATAYLRDMLGVSSLYGVFLSHWHDDHTAGAGDLIRCFSDSLKVVGLPDTFGARELSSVIAEHLPDPMKKNMVKDILDVTSVLKQACADGIDRRTMIAGAVLSPGNSAGWSLEALSPSADDQQSHVLTLAQFLPGCAGVVPKSFDVNSGSVVLQLKVFGVSVLFASDLDVGDTDKRGWRYVVKHRQSDLSSAIVKVGHHGSETAYLPEAWDAISRGGNLRAAVTPFPARNEPLPRASMLPKLRRHCRTLHVTGAKGGQKGRVGKLLSKHSPFESYVSTAPKPIDYIGQVRFRMKQGEVCARVEVFPPAWEFV